MTIETFNNQYSNHLGELLFSLPIDVKQVVRSFEKVCIKLVKAKYSRLFNEVCIHDNMYPKYSNIRLYDKNAEKEALTLSFRQKLVQREVELSCKKIEQLEEDVKRLRFDIHQKIDNPVYIDSIMITRRKTHCT